MKTWHYALWLAVAALIGLFIGASRPSLGTQLSFGMVKTG